MPQPSSAVTPREREGVRSLAQDRHNTCIAEHLGLTEGPVQLHLSHTATRLGRMGRQALAL